VSAQALPWQMAWQVALYGPAGFYTRAEGPAGHFRTAGHAAANLLAGALVRLAGAAGCHAVLDVGAGRGELLAALAAAGPALRLHGVDVVPRPAGLPPGVGWSVATPAADGSRCLPDDVPDDLLDGVLVLGWELLDVVPCPVLEVDGDGVPRTVLVDRDGVECLGDLPATADLEWCARWWPLAGAAPGSRAEVGSARDALWSGIAAGVHRGLLLAVDYAHTAADRPPAGSLAGFRSGRQVPPAPDGGCDITAHLSVDAAAAAAAAAGAGPATLIAQREALLALGVSARVVAPLSGCEGSPGRSPVGLLADLARAGQAAELLDPGGLGGFTWCAQGVAIECPEELSAAPRR
jgi:SAM-dependent MidA family methyltransferase